ncbi:type II secretion system minor pseudopilin GspK [Aliikangiella maris]|uniref:Type II secretion system protein K n=2 Tax=Aliikangiella maris TaxID=3162458 RepID=A0ABV2BXR8_9GAMM
MKRFNELPQISFARKQRGTILITVVLIAAMVIVLVVESVKTVRYQKQLSNNLIHRDQAYSYLMGMEELVKIKMRELFTKNEEETVHLNQAWAQDEIMFPIEGGMMSASIKDMQSCFNLNSIAGKAKNNQNNNNPPNTKQPSKPTTPFNSGQQLPPGQEILEDLIGKIIDSGGSDAKALATVVRDWVDEDVEPSGADGAEDEYYQGLEPAYRTPNSLLSHVSELRAMRGFNTKIYKALRPFVCVLPDPEVNTINVNTIDEESLFLLYAILGGKDVSMADITKAIANRGEKGFEKIDDFFNEFGAAGQQIKQKYASRVDVKSSYFQMTAKAELGNTRVSMKSLLKKDKENNFLVISRYFGKE